MIYSPMELQQVIEHCIRKFKDDGLYDAEKTVTISRLYAQHLAKMCPDLNVYVLSTIKPDREVKLITQLTKKD